jgi:drug/metabolite transporter (DMT)-like permease
MFKLPPSGGNFFKCLWKDLFEGAIAEIKMDYFKYLVQQTRLHLMLQRKQSIWLFFAALCGVLTFKFSFFSGNKYAADNSRVFQYLTATTSLLVLIITVAIVSSVCIAIFVYKNRKLQMRIVFGDLILSLLNIYLYYGQTKKFIAGEGNYDITLILALAIPFFLILSLRGIYKDEKLVKSMDRLR